MLGKVSAWYELLKLGNVSSLRHEIDNFFRGNIINVLNEEEWFKFLQQPRSIHDIAIHFGYSDISFLQNVLDALIQDKTIKFKNGRYIVDKEVVNKWVQPSVFDSGLSDLMVNYARAVPSRLRGQYVQSTGGFNLYNWDDALAQRLYYQARKSALSYTKITRKPVKFLDIGSGSGHGTAQIWVEFYRKGCVRDNFSLIGIEPDEKLLRIAQEEARLRIKSYAHNITDDDLDKVDNYLPKFQKGNVLNLPFPDNTFDTVFASLVLHWTKGEVALKEMLRVTKKGGTVFGTQSFYPDANFYNDLHFKVIEGSSGFFSKKDFKTWAYKYGAKKVKFATPISIYKIVKA